MDAIPDLSPQWIPPPAGESYLEHMQRSFALASAAIGVTD